MGNIRVFFKKLGNAKYISHLDLQRAVVRALVRSGLEISYSEGFNPHPRLAFALPLAIYQESEYEIFDFRTENEADCSETAEKLKRNMPGGIEIIRAAEPKSKISACVSAGYILSLKTEKTRGEMEKLLSGNITVEKRTKSGARECDISAMILKKEFYVQNDGLDIKTTLCASPDNYLNPAYIIKFLSPYIENGGIKRLALYTADEVLME